MNEDLRNGPGNDPRHELLDAVVRSTLDEDYMAVVIIANDTDLIQPFEIVEFLDVKERHCRDPDEQNKWHGALAYYLGSLAGREFPKEEATIITDVARRLQFEGILESGGLNSTEELSTEISEAEAHDWESDEFFLKMDTERASQIRAMPIFQTAEKFATKGPHNHLGDGQWIITKNVRGYLREEMLAVFDEIVFKDVHRFISDKHAGHHQVASGTLIIDHYASSRLVAIEMRRAIDKYVFQIAERATKNTSRTYTRDDARRIIEQGASLPERRDAMLERLGFQFIR